MVVQLKMVLHVKYLTKNLSSYIPVGHREFKPVEIMKSVIVESGSSLFNGE